MLDSPAVRRGCRDVLDALGAARAEIDGLNVFPVPDGDTGTNLFLTVESALEELSGRPSDGDLLGWAYAYEQATRHRRPPVLVEKGLLPSAR